jgi:hypothetical protein
MPRLQKPKIPTKKVKVELYSIHGHIADQPVDYVKLISFVSSLDANARTEIFGERFTRIHLAPDEGERFFFAAYTGSSDATFLVLDLEASTEEERGLETGKVIVRKTLGLIDPERREAVVQLVHNGIRASQIAPFIERIARRASPQLYDRLSLELAPIAGASFLEELEEFEKIQAARMRLSRPNYDWEEYGETLEALGQDSGAKNLEVAAVANRNGTLNKDSGIIGLLKDLIRRSRSIIKSASVRGLLADQSGLITLNLDRHIEARTVEVPVSSTGQPLQAAIRDLSVQFINDRAEKTK